MQLEGLEGGSLGPDITFREVLEHLPGASYVQRGGGKAVTTYITPQMEALLGLPARVVIESADAWTARVHPDDHERLWAEDARSEATGTYLCEYRLRTADGTYRWFRDEAARYDRPDEQSLWIGVLVDIDELKRAEEDQRERERELREAVTRFQTLAEQIPAVTYIEQLGGPVRPTYVSPQYEQLFGFTPEQRLADPELWQRLLHPEDRDRVLAEIAAITDEADGWSLEYRMVHRDGRVVWVRDQAVKTYADDGMPLYYLGVLFDITESKLAQEELTHALDELRRADEIKNTFLTAVSHDLRTPLATILGNAVTLEHADELGLSPDERRSMARTLAAKAQRLTALITDLLDMDRLTRGALEPRIAPEEIAGLIERVVRDADQLAGRRVDLQLVPVVVMVDRSMVERIVENLLTNAAKHTAADVTIRVRTTPVGAGVEIVVEDDGPGIPADQRDRLFRPFERGPSANEQSPGVGLGLSLVARFAELHGGRAWVEDADSGGAAFHVILAGAAD
jgi:PAS domain S-box-containing protein